jgi:hypothetical protein
MKTLKFKINGEEEEVFNYKECDPRNLVFLINDYSNIITCLKRLMKDNYQRKINKEFIKINRPYIEIWNKYHSEDKIIL